MKKPFLAFSVKIFLTAASDFLSRLYPGGMGNIL